MGIKKVELHIHLDGSLRIDTVKDLLQEEIDLPSLKKQLTINKNDKNLVDYLKKFDLPISVMQSRPNLERVSYELVEDLSKEGTIYAEIRVAPIQHLKSGLTPEAVVKSILSGIKKAMKLYPIEINLILCAMRHIKPEDNEYLFNLYEKYKDDCVVGLDLAGDEKNYSVSIFKDFFSKARDLEIPFTIHAGEATGYQSVIDAVELGASRLGHGIRAYEDDKAMSLLKKKEICLECCPISNYHTQAIKDFNNYPIKKYLDYGIPVTLNSDNRTVSDTNYEKEIDFLKAYINLTDKDIYRFNLNAINHAFIPQRNKERLIKILNREI